MSSPDYFELFGLPQTFDIDAEDLQQRWKARVAQVHPDRFASAGAAERRVAMQWSSQINEGYRVLRDPVSRARYICEINGYPSTDRPGVRMDPEFLEQQMQWREALEEIREISPGEPQKVTELIASLSEQVQRARLECEQQVGRMIEAQCWPQAVAALNQWMFVDKFRQEIARGKPSNF